jgi:hypothetical protein
MLDAIKPLLDSGLINEEVGQELNEAWELKLTEAREQVRGELREEFAQRYEHDKKVMVEALDRMVTEGLQNEISAVQAEKRALAEDRVNFQSKIKESATKFNDFMVTKLAEEIGELRKDRRMHNEGIQKLERFIVRALAEEIQEFAQDKRDVVETKVRLVREAREKLETLKTRFTQLHEDIRIARENNFGRRIFEAYAAEFGATHLNEKAEVRDLNQQLVTKDRQLAEATRIARDQRVIVESKEREIRMIKESNVRANALEELLSPLNEEKREIMKNLLESVQTARLKGAFEKYLPAVLADGRTMKAKTALTERVSVVTGDKTVKAADEDRSNVIDIKRLAGL